MLRVVHGNRPEALLAALAGALPAPLDPFAPSTIVVGSHLVGRWVRRELALLRGIAAGLDIAVLDTFLARTYTGDAAARAVGLTALDRRTLGVVLASVLADPDTTTALPAVRAYLDAAPDAGDRAGPRRVQLADRLAALYLAYATTRPDWLPALLAGRVPSDLDGDATAAWQAALLAAALKRVARGAPDRRYALVAQLPWMRRRLELPTPALPGPVAVFGVSYLRRAELEALSDLASTNDVAIYFGNPCEELWDDIGGRRATSTADREAVREAARDPLPLTMWGRPARDTLAALIERAGGDLDGTFVEPDGATARERLLADVLHRRPAPAPAPASASASVSASASASVSASPSASAAGVTILAAPSIRRELELVADHARRRLDADPSLRAHELGVWIAGDQPEAYLAHAPSAFDAVAVPCHLIDAPIDDRGRVGEAMLALLELPTSARTRGDLLRVMTHPAVLARYPHVDAADWVRWTERLGIARGADADAHAGTYLESHPTRFHWDQGVRRLALGAFMVGERGHRGAARVGELELAPEELRPDQQASAATYALLVRSLSADAKWLAEQCVPLARWADIFARLVDAYLAPRDPEATRDLERVRGMVANLAALDIDGRALGFREARAHAQRRFTGERANRGEALAAGVMVAPLAAMRALPFRVTYIVGLDAGAFPASDTPNPLDLRREVRAGDVSSRERDRYAFFEAVGGARDACVLSYVAAEPKSGEVLGPSSCVLELADALAPYLGATSTRDALARLTERHPLHRFAPGAATPTVVPAAAREQWAANVRGAVGVHLRRLGVEVPDEAGMQRLLATPSQAALAAALGMVTAPPAPAAAALRTVSITALRELLESPIQAWAKVALGLAELADDTIIDDDDEPFGLDRPTRAMLLREVFAAYLREPARDLAAHYAAAIAAHQLRGHFPVGVFGSATEANDLGLLERWRTALGKVELDAVTRIAFGRASSPVAQLHAALELPLPSGGAVRLVGQTEVLIRVAGGGAAGVRHESITPLTGELKKAGRHHLRGALDHVVLAAAGLAAAGHAHHLLGSAGNAEKIDHAPWSQADARAYLGGLIDELFGAAHGYALPFDQLVAALAGKPLSFSRRSKPFQILGYGPIERPEGLDLPPDAGAIAQRRFGPLVAHFIGDHAFEEES